MKENLKVIIFDFDETMYYSSNIKQFYVEYIKKTLRSLTKHSDEKILELMKENGFTSGGETRVSFGKNCLKFGVTPQQWNAYRIDNFFQIDYDNAEVVNNDILKELSDVYKLYIVSNEIYENIEFKAKKLGIDLSPFTLVAPKKCNVLDNKFSKQDAYQNILDENDVSAKQAMVFGDRYNVDILPLENLGGQGVLVKHPREIEEYIKENLL
ncbi:MAG: HAD family hydrolase [Clostridiales bacterium]|nr:HAD family hydrolase [Clostridiales bacterium]